MDAQTVKSIITLDTLFSIPSLKEIYTTCTLSVMIKVVDPFYCVCRISPSLIFAQNHAYSRVMAFCVLQHKLYVICESGGTVYTEAAVSL